MQPQDDDVDDDRHMLVSIMCAIECQLSSFVLSLSSILFPFYLWTSLRASGRVSYIMVMRTDMMMPMVSSQSNNHRFTSHETNSKQCNDDTIKPS